MTMLLSPHDGRFDGPLHQFAVRVYYEDTDLSGVVYHANYLRWFERARSDMLRLLEIDQRAAVEAGQGAYAVADLQIRYLRPAKLDDDVLILSACTQLRAASVRMHQRAFRGNELLTEAHLRIGFVSPDGLPCRQPQSWRDAFSQVLAPEETA